ncbi:MAG: hypothetical protein V1757_08230 [Actinomycetota bacterium]
MSRRMRWTGLVVSSVLAACGGQGGVAAGTTSTTVGTGVTAIAGDPAVTTAPTVAVIRIGPWEDREIHSLCLRSAETYTEWITVLEDDEPTPLEILVAEGAAPVSDAIAAGLADFGLPVVSDGCDATLAVEVEGEVLSAGYLGVGTIYVGADLHGRLALSAAGNPTLSAPFERRQAPPETYVIEPGADLPDRAEEAPFVDTIQDDLCAVLQSWITGPFDLQPALDCWIAG